MNLFPIITFLGISSVVILLPDLFRNPDTIKNILGIPSGFIASICILIAFTLRLITKNGESKTPIRVLLLVGFCVFFGFSTIFSFLNYSIHPNFVYSLTRLNTDICMFVALSCGISYLFFQSNNFYKKNYPTLLFVLPLFFTITAIGMLAWPLNAMSYITREDSIVEYLQFFVLIIGFWGAILVSRKTSKKHLKISLMYLFFAFIFLFIAGDEISWGQRIFGFTTPQTIQSANSQKETTIHNLSLIKELVPIGYLAIGIYGSVISIIIRGINVLSKSAQHYFVPNKKYFVIFILPAFYNGYAIFFDHSIGNLSEPAELLLYAAISLFVIELSLRKKRG